MKICGIICEFNPLHNGHAYLLGEAKRQSGCDALVCVMSGNFTQRGDIALLDKYTRARHAVLAGADIVLELPTIFALAPAELFAKGAVRILGSLPPFSSLAFGCENDSEALFREAARAGKEETPAQKAALRECLRTGSSLTRARIEALLRTGRAELADFLRSPNNILGTEYTKALAEYQNRALIFPVLRKGAEHADTQTGGEFSSAAAIRAAVRKGRFGEATKSMPTFAAADIPRYTDDAAFKIIAHSAALTAIDKVANAMDCSEGLENRIAACARQTCGYDELIAAVTTKRYISSRIRRILASAVLGIHKDLVRDALQSPLYLKPLAVRKSRADTLLGLLADGSFPLLARQNDLQALCDTAKAAYRVDELAADLYRLCSKGRATARQTLPLIDDIG